MFNFYQHVTFLGLYEFLSASTAGDDGDKYEVWTKRDWENHSTTIDLLEQTQIYHFIKLECKGSTTKKTIPLQMYNAHIVFWPPSLKQFPL